MIRCMLFWLLAVAIAPPAATAHSHTKRGLEIVHPWTRETPDKDTTTARVFMTIKNRSGRSDRLLSASTPRADKVELHAADAASPRQAKPAATAFVIAPGRDLVLHPSGPSLVLIGMKKGFHAYDTLKMTLVFEKAGRIVVDVMVEEAETEEPHKH